MSSSPYGERVSTISFHQGINENSFDLSKPSFCFFGKYTWLFLYKDLYQQKLSIYTVQRFFYLIPLHIIFPLLSIKIMKLENLKDLLEYLQNQ